MVWPASSGPARRFRSPGGARSASLRPGLASSVPRPRLHEVGASSCAAARCRASTVRVTCGRALESAKGLTRTSQMSFQGRTWRVGATVLHVALPSVAANSKVMSRMRAVHSAMHSSQVPEVTSRRYSLPTCVMRVRICVFAAPARSASSPVPCPPHRASPSAHQSPIAPPLPRPCFRLLLRPLWAAVWDTAGREGSARVHARFYGRWMNSAPASYQRGRGRVMRSRFP